MTDEPKIRAAIDAALNANPEELGPNPKREVPMPPIFTRVEDFLNTPLFEFQGSARGKAGPRLSPGALFNVICGVAGLASIAAALYWYSSAMKYQKLSADLAGELRIVQQQRIHKEESADGAAAAVPVGTPQDTLSSGRLTSRSGEL